MQHKAVYLLFCKFTLHVYGVNHTHHHKTVTTASGTGHFFVQLPPSNVADLAMLEGSSFTKGSCLVLHLVGQLLMQISDARNHKLKKLLYTLEFFNLCMFFLHIIIYKFHFIILKFSLCILSCVLLEYSLFSSLFTSSLYHLLIVAEIIIMLLL